MKIRYIIITTILMFLLINNVYAHQDLIVDSKIKNSQKIFLCEEKYYGYHLYNDEYHFHQVKFDNNEWIITNHKEELSNHPCALKEPIKVEVKFSKCVDGDTAKFFLDGNEITTRFLSIDTPETVHPNKSVEAYGKEASSYTCNTLKTAKKIYIEYDNFEKYDKYNRHLVWVFADEELIQERLVKLGYAQVAYLYNDYKYVSNLQILQEVAQEKKIGIWELSLDQLIIPDDDTISSTKEFKDKSTDEKIEYIIYIILIVLIITGNIIKILKKR